MQPLGPWACHSGPTLRSPGPGRANPFDVFHVPSQISLGTKRVIFQKTHIFPLFIFASSFLGFFSFFMLFGLCFKNTCFMQPLGPWPCHCGQTLRSPGPGRACFPCSFSNFSLFSAFRSDIKKRQFFDRSQNPQNRWWNRASANDSVICIKNWHLQTTTSPKMWDFGYPFGFHRVPKWTLELPFSAEKAPKTE